jgi:hypothetical protein
MTIYLIACTVVFGLLMLAWNHKNLTNFAIKTLLFVMWAASAFWTLTHLGWIKPV